MKLRLSTEQSFEAQLSDAELDAFQAALRETLEALEDWEFQTRTGLERDEMRAVLRDLIAARKSAREEPSSD